MLSSSLLAHPSGPLFTISVSFAQDILPAHILRIEIFYSSAGMQAAQVFFLSILFHQPIFATSAASSDKARRETETFSHSHF